MRCIQLVHYSKRRSIKFPVMSSFGLSRRSFLGLGLTAFWGAAAIYGNRTEESRIYSGKIIGSETIFRACGIITLGKEFYAEVNRKWLLWSYSDFRKWIGNETHKATCTFFTTSFEAYCQKCYLAQVLNSNILPQNIAVGTIWYPTNRPNENHAVNIVFTEQGLEFFEPQTGQFIQISEDTMVRDAMKKMD